LSERNHRGAGLAQRLVVTADLHFGARPQGDEATRELAAVACASGADVLAVAGDVAAPSADAFAACLDLFEAFPGAKLLVPGNHDVWISDGGGSSERKYLEELPALARERGFHMLDGRPAVVGRVGFIGSIGWYDYTFRSPTLEVDEDCYRAGRWPGVCVWNDSRFVNWRWSDAQFLQHCLDGLRRSYEQAASGAEVVVAILHHLPFRELLYESRTAADEFSLAFMGSQRLGELLLEFPKLRYVACGHRHGPGACRRGGIDAFTVGSTYETKRLIELDVASGERRAWSFGAGASGPARPLGPDRRRDAAG